MNSTSRPCSPASRRRILAGTLAGTILALAASGQNAPPVAPAKPEENDRKDVVTLSIFEVTDKKDEGYRSTQTLSGSRTLVNLRDTPNSISVMNRELIDDLMATSVADLSIFSITGEVNSNTEAPVTGGGGYVFRGITASIQLRNGVYFAQSLDTYNIERVEVLRGPTAFLYGEGSAGGLMNQLTKQAEYTNFNRVNLMVGTDDLIRAELDVNRRLSDRFAVRSVFAVQNQGSYQHHAGRDFKAAYTAFNYRPFKATNLNLNLEYARNHVIMAANMLAEQFSTTLRTGATAANAVTTAGYTLLPATNQIINFATLRRSTGNNIVLSDESILPRETNFGGPDAYNRQHYYAINLSVDQKVFEGFNVQLSGTRQRGNREVRTKAGSSQAAVYLDPNPRLADGTANPYLNQYYTEFYHQKYRFNELIHNARITAVYDWKLPFMTQRIVGTYTYHDAEPVNERLISEFVDPKSPQFVGALVNANTVAAATTNTTILNQNRFYRRFYLKDGDGARLTAGGVVPGRSVMLTEVTSNRLTNRLYRAPGYGFGASGTYFGGRLHTLLGWRHDSFNQDPENDYLNSVTGEVFMAPNPTPVHTCIDKNSINYGGVVEIARFVKGYFNYAQSVALSSGFGAAGLVPGTFRGPGQGEGNEYGLRWSFFEGRLESNWTYYVTNALRVAANPAVPAVVRQTELGALFTDINTAGADTQATRARGLEFETVANLTRNWRLTWNFATNKLATANRYPDLKYYQAQAKAKNLRTPETDAFLATVPDGTPLPGFTKVRSNLLTNYRLESGPLKGFLIGGGGQYRDKSYQGNFDLNRDGVAEELWAKGFILYNLMLGYRGKLFGQPIDYTLNVSNLTDRNYFNSASLATGGWGPGRDFRFSARTRF